MSKNNQQNQQITLGRRALDSEGLPFNWELLNPNDLEISQNKTVFIFGGNTTNLPVNSNGNAKIIEQNLNQKTRIKTNIYSFTYATEPIKSAGYLSEDYENEMLQIFENSFKPWLFDSKGNMKEKQGIEKVFKNNVFVAHCGGSNFVNIIIDGFYNTLLQKYPPRIAEILTSKIQYYAYAPNEMPQHNVTALMITPFIDPSYSWAKALSFIENQKVDVDYPRGVYNRILKAKNKGTLSEEFDSIFEDTRAIMFKVGQTTFYLPSRMNPHRNIGDHSIECISMPHILNSKTEFEETAQITQYATQLYLNNFLSDVVINKTSTFDKIAKKIDENLPTPQKVF